MQKKSKLVMTGVLAATVLTASGCGLVGPAKTSSPVEPTATGVPGPNKAAASQAPSDQEVAQTLYFSDEKGFVVPVQMNIPKNNAPATEALDYMQQGGKGEATLNGTGLHAIIPKDSKFSLNIQNGLATIDVSKNTLNDFKTAQSAQQFVDAVVWELTSFPTIKNVQFTFGGSKLDTLPVSGQPIGEPLNRTNGINLQLSNAVTSPTDSTSITLYFPSENKSGSFQYLVPVTRMIPKSAGADMVKETIAQLQTGPMSASLLPVLAPTVQVKNDSVSGDTAHVDFSEPIVAKNDASADLTLRSLLLSLTENVPNAQKVQITVNGKAPVDMAKNFDLSKPVMRPTYINKDL
ncbi:GerMN domain-containing protein [Fodinisporobacter ferrooxydans]|uniref:GerMN domain-containing protein n=1 Tax=Fodinisporobacter ferrooxydans TaxID=2901836 RepID=A0ABY4CJM6_9BACL|nr:GerMN domain-containing protein [Alicyclobacillaceae bacterium MYW30-H2]